MATIKGEIVIGRPIEVIFDLVSDTRNEPKYNPDMLSFEQLTDGPIGMGTRFRAVNKSRGRTLEMVIEFMAFDRPTRLASLTSMESIDIRGALTFEPDPAGTRMKWCWDVQPKGFLKLLSPVIGRIGKRQEDAIWAGLKKYLEATPKAEPSA